MLNETFTAASKDVASKYPSVGTIVTKLFTVYCILIELNRTNYCLTISEPVIELRIIIVNVNENAVIFHQNNPGPHVSFMIETKNEGIKLRNYRTSSTLA